jgi:long-chain acyl-CoA synthetase
MERTDWQRAERRYADPTFGEGTLPELFEESAGRHADRTAQGYKGGVYDRSLAGSVLESAPPGEYRTLTYRGLREIVRHLAAGFRDLGVKADDRVGIYADTRMEWAQCDLALLAAGAVVTTVYTDSSTEQVEYLLDDPDASGVVCGSGALAERALAAIEAGDIDVEFLVVMDAIEDERFAAAPLPVHSLKAVHDRGASAFDREGYDGWLDARDPKDLASLIYTSGTTGKPKGVRLTHRNFRANVEGIYRRFGPRPDKPGDTPTLDEGTRSLSFLPLAHVFERTSGHFTMFAAGATVAYAESADTIGEDIEPVRPTTATSVPRVYERIFDSMVEEAGDGPRKRVIERALDVGRAYQHSDGPSASLRVRHAIADRLVFERVRETLGGRIEFFISGGGTLSPELAELFAGMGLPIFEGYGLTETAPVVSVNPPEAPQPGTIGLPLGNVEVDLDDARLDERHSVRDRLSPASNGASYSSGGRTSPMATGIVRTRPSGRSLIKGGSGPAI